MINLLQDKEYRKALVEDMNRASLMYIETVTLAPFLVVLLREWLIAGGSANILTNSLKKSQIHDRDFLTNRDFLRELGAKVYSYDAPHLNHQKIVLIAPDIVYLGSHNMTAQSNFNNRETSIRLVNKAFYDKLLAGFRFKTGTVE